MRAGTLSATRHEDGSFAIDPAELMRWYEAARHRFHLQRGAKADRRLQPSTGEADGATGNANGAGDLPIRFARIEAELAGMQQLIEAEKRRAEAAEKRADEIRAERDDWKHQANSPRLGRADYAAGSTQARQQRPAR